MSNALPESPEDMPVAFHNGDDNTLRNCLVSLDIFRSVNINWEMDVSATNVIGEACGKWTVEIETNRRTFACKHSRLTNALWFAYTLADSALTKAYEDKESARISALAKLTTEDKKVLGLSR